MPNWCECELSVRVDDDHVAEIMKFVNDVIGVDEDGKLTPLSFSKLIPEPEEITNTTSPVKERNQELIDKYGAGDWYHWRILNWGVKWEVDAERGDFSPGDRYVHYTFLSANSPPIEFFVNASKMYPHLEFSLKYDESGMGFMGVAKIENGVVDDQVINY